MITAQRKKAAVLLVRLSAEQKREIETAVESVGANLPAGARMSVNRWLLAVALEAARAVTGVRS